MASGQVLAATLPDAPGLAALPSVTIEQPNDAVVSQPHKKTAVRHVRALRLETIDTASLSMPVLSTSRVPSAASLVMEAHATALRPAPLPDQDLDAPGPDVGALSAEQEASVTPSVYGPTDHFSGDGFATGSNLESDKNNRRRPGGGMSLSIPVP